MSCPRCSADTDENGVCGACADEPDIGSSKTMLTPPPPTSSTMHYGSDELKAPGPAVRSAEKARDQAMSVGATLSSGSQEAAALANDLPPDAGNTSPQLTNSMIGQRLGSYKVLDVLGEGGMGRVYLAEHIKIGRRVALKMLHSHLAQSPEVVRRFFDEARAVNRILHEHIVEITDFVENEEGNNYFIMEHLKGAPLSDVMEDEEDGSRISRCLAIGVQVASALSAVHAANIVHRDLKPENIFLTQRGGQQDFVKLLDFGIAKLVGDHGGGMKLQTTQAGVIMGTPDYMSPEQASADKLDFRTDIYSLGVILYELCTGILPFTADSFGDLVVLHKTKKPLRPNKVRDLAQSLPEPLEALIMQCLEKQPSKRPQSAKEIEDRLNEIAWGFAVELEQFELTGADGRRSGRRGVLFGAAGLAAAAAALTFALTRGDAPKSTSPEPSPAVPTTKLSKAPVIVVAPDKEVSVSFLSEPAGAMVYTMGADAELMGVTPFTGSLTQSSEPVQFEFRLPGHLSRAVGFTPDKRGSLRVDLEPVPAKVLTPKERRLAAKRRREAKAAAAKAAKSSATKDKTKTKVKPKDRGFKEGAVMDPFAK